MVGPYAFHQDRHRQFKVPVANVTLFSSVHICFERITDSFRSFHEITTLAQVAAVLPKGPSKISSQFDRMAIQQIWLGVSDVTSYLGDILSTKETQHKNDIISFEK
ncbi:hypothetical protein Tco_0953814 [Tanacetum coccineum]|uniref:Uncharacterized protein n=1 Tax=Tanacetum coccineum TaxID=301880 RepID=A0ABQ5E4A6_9ASTR